MNPELASLDGSVHRVVPGVADDLLADDPAGVFSKGAKAGDHLGLLTSGQWEQLSGRGLSSSRTGSASAASGLG